MYCYVIWYSQYNKFFVELSGKMEVLLISIQMIELLLLQFCTSNIYYHNINVLTNLCRGTFLFLWLYEVKMVLIDLEYINWHTMTIQPTLKLIWLFNETIVSFLCILDNHSFFSFFSFNETIVSFLCLFLKWHLRLMRY